MIHLTSPTIELLCPLLAFMLKNARWADSFRGSNIVSDWTPVCRASTAGRREERDCVFISISEAPCKEICMKSSNTLEEVLQILLS